MQTLADFPKLKKSGRYIGASLVFIIEPNNNRSESVVVCLCACGHPSRGAPSLGLNKAPPAVTPPMS